MEGERDALIIATGSYDSSDLRTLRSPTSDAALLAATLEAPLIGAYRVSQCIDRPAHETRREIEKFFAKRSRRDLLLLYVSCHGIKDDNQKLYFAAADTQRDYLKSTAIEARFIREQMDQTRAKSVILLLDCCYSGAFVSGSKASKDVHVEDQLAGTGRAILTATNATEYAWEGESLIDEHPEPSVFTSALVEGLASGDADEDGDGYISLDDLYSYVWERTLRAKRRQHPSKFVFQAEGKLIIARRAVKGGEPASSHPTSSPVRGQDVETEATLYPEEARLGVTVPLRMRMPSTCPVCAGVGNPPNAAIGECAECQGKGITLLTRTITVRIPAGVKEGQRVRIPGKGAPGRNGGPAGDLFVVIHIGDPKITFS